MQEVVITRSHKTPFGALKIASYKDQLCMADWLHRKGREAIDQRIATRLNSCFEEGTTSVIEETIRQLTEYFHKERTTFDLPLLMLGTDFQIKVWEMLLTIPYSETLSYLQLSDKLGNKDTIRAVASANGANAISIIVPCHRIIGSNKQLIGYAGGLAAKQGLLKLENALPNSQLNLF